MADTKTSALTAIPALDGADVMPIVDATDTVTKKVSVTQLDARWANLEVVNAIDTIRLGAGHYLYSHAGDGYSVVMALSSTPTNSMLAIALAPIMLAEEISFQSIGVPVTAANAGASAAVTFGVYDSAFELVPGSDVASAAGSLNTTGVKSVAFGSALVLPAGTYWLALGVKDLDTAGANPTFRGFTGAGDMARYATSSDIDNLVNRQTIATTTNGAMPSTLTLAQGNNGTIPHVALRRSS